MKFSKNYDNAEKDIQFVHEFLDTPSYIENSSKKYKTSRIFSNSINEIILALDV